MCIAVPVKILAIDGKTATIDLGNNETSMVNITMVDVKVGDYVVLNTGFAVRVVDEAEAKETLELWKRMEEVYKDAE